MKTPLMTLLLAATLLCGLASASAADQEFGAGSGVTLTRAAWAYRIVRLGERQPCKMLQQADCSSTRVEISNNSDAELACAGQVYLLLGEKKVGYIENFGTLVTARGKETPFEFEIDAAIDPARSFVICNTTAERDEADTGDPCRLNPANSNSQPHPRWTIFMPTLRARRTSRDWCACGWYLPLRTAGRCRSASPSRAVFIASTAALC
jgi:hypothetical protein